MGDFEKRFSMKRVMFVDCERKNSEKDSLENERRQHQNLKRKPIGREKRVGKSNRGQSLEHNRRPNEPSLSESSADALSGREKKEKKSTTTQTQARGSGIGSLT